MNFDNASWQCVTDQHGNIVVYADTKTDDSPYPSRKMIAFVYDKNIAPLIEYAPQLFRVLYGYAYNDDEVSLTRLAAKEITSLIQARIDALRQGD